MRITSRTLAPLAAAALVAAATAGPAAALTSDQRQDLAATRAATAKYHNVQVALEDGYVPSHECAAGPDGVMGYHYINFARFADPLNITAPPILVYQPSPSGGLRLVAVEFLVPDADQDLATDDDRPWLYGVPFDGPMPEHEPGTTGHHYDLHVWVWQHNPDGIFATWNRAGSC